MKTLDPETPFSTAAIIRRLWDIAWRYRVGCMQVLLLQTLLLVLTIGALGLMGLAIDFIHHRAATGVPPPAWPFGFAPPSALHPMAVLTLLASGILAAAGLRSAITYWYNTSVVRLVQGGIVVELRARAFDKLQRFSFRFFDEHASGTLINRITSDVQHVRLFVDGVLIPGVVLILSLTFYLVYMFRINVALTCACLTTTPLLWLVSSAFARSVRLDYRHNRDLVDSMILALSERVQGIQVIKGFNREAQELDVLAGINRAVRDHKKQIIAKVAFLQPRIDILNHLNIVVLLAFGGYLIIVGQLALGTGLVVFLGLLQRFASQVNTIATITDNIQQSLASAQRLFEVLERPAAISSPPGAPRIGHARGAVAFDHVTFGYAPGIPALHDIVFEVPAGRSIGILGTTGAGKSTLLSLIPRFYDVDSGRVLVDGIDVRTLDLDDLRRQTGVVFQESFLFSSTIAANIAYGSPRAGRADIERAARLAAAHDFITALPNGYDTLLGEGGADLSGGQRQRLSIARAVLPDPPILLLDDPTAAVDAETEQEIITGLERVMAGRTTFIVSHRISVLQRTDMILVMHDGRIVQRGTHDELMRIKGHYRHTAHLQSADAHPATGEPAETGGGAP